MSVVPPPPPPPTQAEVKSSGCWKWGACGCVVAIIIAVIGIATIVAFVFGMIKSTDVYRGAVAAAERDPRVIEALGAPMHAGIWVAGSVHVNDAEGEADFRFPLIGSKSRGRVHVLATRSGGTWHYTELTVTPSNGPTIDVVGP